MNRKATRERPRKLTTQAKTVKRFCERIDHYRRRVLRVLTDSIEESTGLLEQDEIWSDELLEVVVLYYGFLHEQAIKHGFPYQKSPFFNKSAIENVKNYTVKQKFFKLHELATIEKQTPELFKKKTQSRKRPQTLFKVTPDK